jgi:molecular chaperone GrpE
MNEENDIELSDEGLDDSVIAEEHQGEALKKLRLKLKEVEMKAKEHLEGWQRAQADFVNLRKRDEEAKLDFMKFASASVAEDLLPVLDGLSLAVSHGDKGVEQIYSLMLKALKKHGLEEFNPVGEAFDPAKHEAVSMKKTENKSEDHQVLDVLQKGYILHDKIIRPAKVVVGEFSN